MAFRIFVEKLKEKLVDLKEATPWLKEQYTKYLKKSIEQFAGIGGKRVEPDLADKRLSEGCEGCPNNVEAEVLPYIIAPTCSRCGCILELLAKFERHLDLKKVKITDDKCDRWNTIDSEYTSGLV